VHFEHRHICSLLAISKISTNCTFGANLFYVQLTRETYDKLEKQGKSTMYNMWLGIKVATLFLMSPSSREMGLEVQLSDIERVVVETEGVILKVESLGTCEYSLNTYQPFEILELIKYYKFLAKTMTELDNKESILAQSKEEARGLDARSTLCEKLERETMAVEPNHSQNEL
jgi:hypothetical protein